MAASQYAEACTKFEAARSLYTSAGIFLNLADCYEKTGRTASAWTTFGEAAAVATRTQRPDDAAEALRRQTVLEPHLVRIVFHLEGQTPGLELHRDGTDISAAVADTPIPVDPGPHEFRAEAPGYLPFSKTVTVSDAGKTVTVGIPSLAQAPRAPVATPVATTETVPNAAPTEAPASGGQTQRTIGWAVGGVGVLGMAAAGVLSIVAESSFKRAEQEQGHDRVTDSESSGSLADAATVAVIAGAVAAGAGVVIWVTAPSAHVSVGTTGSAVILSGRF